MESIINEILAEIETAKARIEAAAGKLADSGPSQCDYARALGIAEGAIDEIAQRLERWYVGDGR